MHEEDGTPMNVSTFIEDGCVQELRRSVNMLCSSGGLTTAWGDVTSAELNPRGVHEARKLEMKFFKEMGGYSRCPK